MERRSIPIHLLCLWFGAVGHHGNRRIEGEKKLLWLPGRSPSFCSYAKTPESPDKNNIPHLSDGLQGIPVKLSRFLCVCQCACLCVCVPLAYLIKLKPSGALCGWWMYILSHIEIMKTRAWESWFRMSMHWQCMLAVARFFFLGGGVAEVRSYMCQGISEICIFKCKFGCLRRQEPKSR